jgi:pimeloyl-ACP methyl ester carboxylesterase
MGGAVAMELAARAPELVRTLVLVATWQRTDAWLRRIFGFRERLLDEAGGAGEQLLQLYVSLWAWASPYWEGDGIAVTATEQLISQSDTRAWDEGEKQRYLGHLHASIEHDCEERLALIAAPTLVVVGDEDVLTPLRFARAMAERIPDARLEIVPGQGHAFCFENPQLFADLVRGFATR